MVKCIRILCLAMVAAAACQASESAAYMFEAGEKAMKAGDSLQALSLLFPGSGTRAH